jgi:hypothetical protein
VEDDPRDERQLNIHLDPANLAGAYANFANVSFSDYEFTITFARIDHEVEEGDSWSKWETREGIRNLPESGR